ncbi:hypothetical protein SAE01_27320 [Segetibacter aerophilus]|uniref:Sialidase domain-containing protein n=2 Tax=Segetibacter aerophilus TaxID=670293 RepID=A0A512BE46_9BACT|nr:hypothetical protein SAE01_27320 [Segetibacter aerophilus]
MLTKVNPADTNFKFIKTGMLKTLGFILVAVFVLASINGKEKAADTVVVAEGKMPNLVKDKNNTIHIVYGTGDSIMYLSSEDGRSFSGASLIAVLPNLFASAMRGPQIAASSDGVTVTACSSNGNIFSYHKTASGKWSKATKVNDVDESAKEALMGLSADGESVFAVWLGVKNPKGQSVYGAKSNDGGKTWSRNIVVYASPDSTVCECCKPSVVVKDNLVYVMFRNWLHGSRDLYVVSSSNGGKSFEHSQKLGDGTWKLKGCPMDGGGLAISKDGTVETVWRREGKIFASAVGMPEKEIGEGRGCTIETVNGKKVYAWGLNGDVILMNSAGVKKNLGKGSLPLVKALNNEHVLCVWENDRQIRASVVEL